MTRIPFILLSTSDGSPLTGATPNVTISKDGAAFTSATNTPSEIGNGYYYIDLTTAETTVNNNVIVRATATGAQPTAVVWEPEATMPNIQSELTTYGAAKTSDIPDISGLATATDITNSQAAIISAMPTTAGLATTSDVTSAQTAIIGAMPDISGLATKTDISSAEDTIIGNIVSAMPDISGLSTFDAATDTVTIDATQAAGMATATGFATPSDIPTDYAKPSDITAAQTALTSLLNSVLSGLYHWQVNDTMLTVYNNAGTAIGAYTLTKDSDGNIISVTPVVTPNEG